MKKIFTRILKAQHSFAYSEAALSTGRTVSLQDQRTTERLTIPTVALHANTTGRQIRVAGYVSKVREVHIRIKTAKLL